MFQNTDPHCRTSRAACIAAPGLLAACPFRPPDPSAATPAACQDPHLPWSLKGPLALARRTKQLRSSSKQAAGRAWPGRGPRVPRKPQAAQVEPGRRHRKSRVSSLPFLRGDPVTRKREAPPSGGSQRGSRPQHAAPQTLRFKAGSARSCRRQRGEAASIASRAGAGEGSAELRAGRLVKAAPAEAERTNASRPPCPRPPGALRRPARGTGRRRGAPGSLGGRLRLSSAWPPGAPESPRCQSARAASSWFAHAPPVSPGAGHSGVRGTEATVSPALGPRATLPPGLSGGSPSGLPESFTASLGTRCALLSQALSPRCRWADGGCRNSCLPAAHLGVPGSSKHRGLSTRLPSPCGHEYFRSQSRQTFNS